MNDRKVGLLLFCGTLACCLWTASSTVQGSDSGELITVAARGGTAHPPGFPVYVALAHTAAMLPFGSVAYRLSLLSALGAAIAVLCVYGSARTWGAGRFAAAVACVGLALSPPFWSQGGVAEVFSWAAAAVAAIAWASATRRPKLAALLFGLGLAIHPAVIITAPLVVACTAFRPRALAASAALMSLGLCSFFTLLVDFGGPWRWGDLSTIGAMIRHALRADYGGLSLTISSTGERGVHALRFLTTLPLRWLALALLAVLGLRRASIGLGVSLVLTLLFFGLFNIGETPLYIAVTERFFVLGDVLVGIVVALGGQRVFSMLEQRIRAKTLACAVLAVSLCAAAALAYPKANWRGDHTIERYARDVLKSAAPGALILGRGDLPSFPILYAQEVLGLRPDVAYVDVGLLLYRWYYDAAERKVGALGIPFNAKNVDTVGLALSQTMKRPVYVANVYNDAIRLLVSHPEGILLRLFSVKNPPLSCDEAKRRLQAFPVPRVRAENPWADWTREQYQRSWDILASCRLVAP